MTTHHSFPLGQIVATPGALEALKESGESPLDFIKRHAEGDWGEIDAEDREANEQALMHGARLLSAYRTRKDTKLWIITEADRSATNSLARGILIVTFDMWYDEMLRIAYSWNLGWQEVESVPIDWYISCWRRNWSPSDALYSAMVVIGLMNPDGYF